MFQLPLGVANAGMQIANMAKSAPQALQALNATAQAANTAQKGLSLGQMLAKNVGQGALNLGMGQLGGQGGQQQPQIAPYARNRFMRPMPDIKARIKKQMIDTIGGQLIEGVMGPMTMGTGAGKKISQSLGLGGEESIPKLPGGMAVAARRDPRGAELINRPMIRR